MFTESTSQEEQQTGNKQVMMIAVIIGLVAVVGLGMAFVKQQTSSTAESTLENQAEDATLMNKESSPDTATVMVDETGVKVVQIEAGAFYYKPDQITVKKGDTVRIVISSVDMMHDFTLDAFNVATPVTKAGETNTVEFVADQVGSFEFYCSVGQHRAQGQVGTLVVTE